MHTYCYGYAAIDIDRLRQTGLGAEECRRLYASRRAAMMQYSHQVKSQEGDQCSMSTPKLKLYALYSSLTC